MYPNPCCPVASSRKLRAVVGVRSSYNRKIMRPTLRPSIDMSNYGQPGKDGLSLNEKGRTKTFLQHCEIKYRVDVLGDAPLCHVLLME